MLTGGGGHDTFVFTQLNDSKPGVGNFDTIMDFTPGSDHLDFSAIMGINGVQGGQPLGPGATLNAHAVGWVTNGANIDVYANASGAPETLGTSGPGGPDMQVHLNHVTSLAASNFLFHV